VRIAVSGTHCSGKSTLVEDFAAGHRDYVHEPEPYEWLEELHGESFAEEPGVDDFQRQLELSVERLSAYGRGARVIAERSPIDFVAYMLALRDLRRGGRASGRVEAVVELAARGMEHVDLLVVLPLNETDGIVASESEESELREAMNDRLLEIVATDEFGLLGGLRVIEVQGTRRARLAALERAIGEVR
jgi:AAA domain-containing protein